MDKKFIVPRINMNNRNTDIVLARSWETSKYVMGFWYSKNTVAILLASLFLIVLSISFLIPSFQSPDEFNHVKRAYLLSKGKIILENENNETGGYIDSGLLDYMRCFNGIVSKYDKKIDNPGFKLTDKIEWSNNKKFSGLPNTAVYFPLPYLPQALAFFMGETVGLSIKDTYYLARFFSLITTLFLLGIALLLYPAPLIVLAAFLTPMSLFQMGSASLDSVTFALSALAGALYMRGSENKYSFTTPMLYALTICLFALATTRINLFFVCLMPAFLYLNRPSITYLVHSLLLFIVSLTWIIFNLKTNQGMPTQWFMPTRELSTIEIAFYYIKDPVSLFNVLYTTLTNWDILSAYWIRFIGVLGWGDTPLSNRFYNIYSVLLCLLAIISFQRNISCLFSRRRVLFVSVSVVSVFLLFFILLVTFTYHPAKVVLGIQGRYFTPVFIFLGYAVFDKRLSNFELRVGVLITFIMLCISINYMSPKLIDRYWLSNSDTFHFSASTIHR